MASLKEIVAQLDAELKTSDIPDYPGALNGLQLENRSGEVTKVASAVDATLPVIRKAIDAGADLLIVHHGIFWQSPQRLVDAQFKKLQLALDAGLAIYSSHIPLDVHPTFGNNALLSQKLDPSANWEPFFDWKGIQLGMRAFTSLTVGEMAQRLKEATDTPLLAAIGDLSQPAGSVGVITGGAGSEVGGIAELGIDTFVSGEAPHWAHGVAEEAGIALLLGGHYATEIFGVIRIADYVEEQWGLAHEKIHYPSGL